MRISHLIPFALLACLAVAVPAGAAEQSTTASDYKFSPKRLSVEPGDTVTWNFAGLAEHTTTSDPGQPEKWDSGLKGVGGTYSHTFTKLGKFQYLC
ncbi:MAG TPA: hypothetical protein VFQ12_10530, partial [Thermoleophilaceae bacterium]|nr:hypothetical protein [Thermoleophilaceae bacterium]